MRFVVGDQFKQGFKFIESNGKKTSIFLDNAVLDPPISPIKQYNKWARTYVSLKSFLKAKIGIENTILLFRST